MSSLVSRAPALALLLSSVVACNSIHAPSRPGVAMAMKGGSLVFVRDGQEYEHGFAGGGLVDAVDGNAGAVEHAETYRDFTIAGFVLSLTAIVPVAAGAVVLAVSADDRNGDPSTGAVIGGATLMGGGLALSITGLVFSLSAQPHLFDAINIYNDSVDAELSRPRTAPPGAPLLAPSGPPPGAPPGPLPAPPPLAPTAPPPGAPPQPPAQSPAQPPPQPVPPLG